MAVSTATKARPAPPAEAVGRDAHWSKKMARLRARQLPEHSLVICDDQAAKKRVDQAKLELSRCRMADAEAGRESSDPGRQLRVRHRAVSRDQSDPVGGGPGPPLDPGSDAEVWANLSVHFAGHCYRREDCRADGKPSGAADLFLSHGRFAQNRSALHFIPTAQVQSAGGFERPCQGRSNATTRNRPVTSGSLRTWRNWRLSAPAV